MGRRARTPYVIAATTLVLLASPRIGGTALAQWGPAAVLVRAAPHEPGLPLTLRRLVDPSTRIESRGEVIRFALHGLIHFERLTQLFEHIDREAGRWQFESALERQAFGDGLLKRGVESRIVSMETDLPLELLLTHTREDLERILDERARMSPVVFKGQHWQLPAAAYKSAVLAVRERWSTGLNCWSASPSIAGRVLSNWYVIEEGIELFGATYDSTEHFWQAVKFHPAVTVGDLHTLLSEAQKIDWVPWLTALERDQFFYLPNAYAVEFLKQNLRADRLTWFASELARLAKPGEHARAAQQRRNRAAGEPVRFTAFQEKVLWGDVADVLHLVFTFSARSEVASLPGIAQLRDALAARHFDAIVLPGYAAGPFPFLSSTFQELMFEIWKVKFIELPRFGEVIRSTAGVRLDHFLNGGDSPDIPIPVYVDYLNRIRNLAVERAASRP